MEHTKILIVDDERSIRELLMKILAGEGYVCTPASNAKEAEDLLAGSDFDLLLSDIRMPGESGLELIRHVKNKYPYTAIIMVTAIDDPQEAKAALEIGVYGYVIKPFESNQILICVENALRRNELEKKDRCRREELERAVEKRTAEYKKKVQELQNVQKELQESEEKFRTAIEHSNDAVAMAKEGKRIYVNQKFLDLFGYESTTELLGAPITMVVHPDDRLRVSEIVSKRAEGGSAPPRHQFKGIRKDGKIVWIEASASMISLMGEVVSLAFYRDITDRKRAESALLESEEKFRTIFESAYDAVVMIDAEGDVSFWNRSAAEIFGYTPAEALGKNLHRLLAPERYHPDHFKAFGGFQKKGQGGAVGKTEDLFALRKSGEEIPIDLSLASVRIKGKWHAIGIIRDLTDKKKAEAALLKATNDLNENKEKLQKAYDELRNNQAQILQQEKMASIGQLAAGVAHEINNPTGFVSSNLKTLVDYQKDIFNLIQAYKELLLQLNQTEPLSDGILQKIQRIKDLETRIDIDFILDDIPNLIAESREGTERIKKIVIDLKDFAHPGKQELVYANINQNLDSTLNIVWNEIKYKATVVKEYGEIPEVRCYPQQLNQVFMNLLVNAAQAIEKQGEIKIHTSPLNDHVEIRISDTGTGITEGHIKKIFEPFFTTKEVGKGTGLGLHVAYNIIKKHHGTLGVQSKVGSGTTFTIKIPVNGSEKAA